jgi:signal transduction histidine kinase
VIGEGVIWHVAVGGEQRGPRHFGLATSTFHLRMICGALIILCGAANYAMAADAKRVMLLHSFGPQFKPWSDYARTIRTETNRRAKWPIDFSDFSLASARSDSAESEAPLVQYLRALYLKEPLDLIIAIGAPAASFIQRHRSELFPTTPMIFTAVDRRRVDYHQLSENDTVVAVDHDFAAILKTILQVLPDTKTVAIVNGVSPNEVFWHEEIQRQLAPFANSVVLKWYDELPFSDILRDAAKLPPRSAILWHLMNVDAAGVSHEENESLNALASVASAPIFSYDSSFFEGALVGGPMFSVMESSAITANVANRILSGERAGDIKTQPVKFAAPRFDWRQMQRWGISEGLLPPGSTVDFRSPSLWQAYRVQIALIAAVILLQGGLISGLLWQRRRRYRAESDARRRMAELAHVNRYTTAGELTATITHEINQPLGSILINTESAESILRSASPDLNELKEILADIRHDDERATEVIRRLRSLLKRAPFEARTIDLNATAKEAVDLLAPVMKQRTIAIQTRWSPGPLLVNADSIQIQQVVINLVRNSSDAIWESAAAERVIDISTSKRGRSAELLVADSGGGIPADSLGKLFDPFFSTKKEGMGMGLSIVRTIVEAHKGTISAENVNGGATFRIKLPISEA